MSDPLVHYREAIDDCPSSGTDADSNDWPWVTCAACLLAIPDSLDARRDPVVHGSVPGLLRRGSPVVVIDGPAHFLGRRGTVHALDEWGQASIAFDGCVSVVIVMLSRLALDLTDRTGRIHAAWWLGARGIHWPTYWSVENPRNLWGLDPNDPRKLADGHDWSRAEALRITVLAAPLAPGFGGAP